MASIYYARQDWRTSTPSWTTTRRKWRCTWLSDNRRPTPSPDLFRQTRPRPSRSNSGGLAMRSSSRRSFILACLLGCFGIPCEGRCDPPCPAGSKAVQVIDLASALKLAGVENCDILLARQRVVESL